MKTVAEITALTKEWVLEHSGEIPGFTGAYLFGGITQLPPEALFPNFRDVDLIVVVQGEGRPQEENQEILYQGLMLEVGFLGAERHRSAEQIAADPSIAPNFVCTQILADPDGLLVPLQQAVIGIYRRREWAAARCQAEKDQVLRSLQGFEQAQSAEMAVVSVWNFINNISGLLALAHLLKPTHRRSLTLLKDILAVHNRLDLHEEALQVWGTAHFSRQDAQTMLQETGRAFDRALEVKRTPSPFDFKLHRHLRPYFIGANQEMIDEGNPREATFWIIVGYLVAVGALMNDAPDDEQPAFYAPYRHWIEAMGFHTPESRAVRAQIARTFFPKVFTLADQILAQNPEVID